MVTYMKKNKKLTLQIGGILLLSFALMMAGPAFFTMSCMTYIFPETNNESLAPQFDDLTMLAIELKP